MVLIWLIKLSLEVVILPYLISVCKKPQTESKDNLIIQYFSTTNAGEECSGNDINNRQIWILKDNNTYYPGISFSYPIKDEARAKTLFQEILNTFKFTNPPSEELSTFSNNYLILNTHLNMPQKVPESMVRILLLFSHGAIHGLI